MAQQLFIMKSTIFCDITEFNPLKVNRRFGGAYHLHLQGRRISAKADVKQISCSAYSSTLNLEAICSSEKSADFQRITRSYIHTTFRNILQCQIYKRNQNWLIHSQIFRCTRKEGRMNWAIQICALGERKLA
jgi:hypothetical protein